MANKAKNDLKYPMYFLGVESRTSKKSGKKYSLAKFQKEGTTDTFDFYVGSDDLEQEIGVLQQFKKYDVLIDLTAFKGNPQVDLIGIGGESE